MAEADWVAGVVARLERPLLAYVRGLLNGDLDQSRDVVQEAFLELCRAERAAIEPRLAAWLFTVCRRRVIDLHRKEKRMTALSTDPPTVALGPADATETRDTAQAVFARLSRLPANQQEAVRLRFLQQFSYRDIAGVMGLSESHVGVLLHLALKNLRESFAETPVREAHS